MKRFTATRKLKRRCKCCGLGFSKGDVYYKERKVYAYESYVIGFEHLVCPKCKYKNEQSKERFEKFKANCPHPDKLIDEKWCYIPGECVMQPDYSYCTLCGKILY